jgi:hypothetical protein
MFEELRYVFVYSRLAIAICIFWTSLNTGTYPTNRHVVLVKNISDITLHIFLVIFKNYIK